MALGEEYEKWNANSILWLLLAASNKVLWERDDFKKRSEEPRNSKSYRIIRGNFFTIQNVTEKNKETFEQWRLIKSQFQGKDQIKGVTFITF